MICIFIFYFHFLFSFSENCFHFQKIRILKICLVWLLIFCFHEIKILKIYDILISCLFVFLDLLKIIFIVTVISFYPRWSFCSQKILKMRIYYFLVISCFHFYWKCFQKSKQIYFHHRFVFSVKNENKKQSNQTSLI